MARRRFFVDRVDFSAGEGAAELSGDDARHLTRVLRVEPGQQFEISDNAKLYLAEIAEVHKDRLRFRVLSEFASAPALPTLVLFASLIKFDRFEWLVEKATELGVSQIVPVEAARSEAGLLAAAAKRVERWRKIARESSQQSRRVRMPVISEARKLRQALEDSKKMAAQGRFLLDENPGAPPLLSCFKLGAPASYAVLTGPEGGWKDSEREDCAAAGWIPVSLGPLILRAETAAIAAVGVIQSSTAATDYTKSL